MQKSINYMKMNDWDNIINDFFCPLASGAHVGIFCSYNVVGMIGIGYWPQAVIS